MASNFKLKNNNSTELNIQHVDNAPAVFLTSTDLSKISGLGTSSLTPTQIKDAIEKIEGLEASASEIDKNIPKYNNRIRVDNSDYNFCAPDLAGSIVMGGLSNQPNRIGVKTLLTTITCDGINNVYEVSLGFTSTQVQDSDLIIVANLANGTRNPIDGANRTFVGNGIGLKGYTNATSLTITTSLQVAETILNVYILSGEVKLGTNAYLQSVSGGYNAVSNKLMSHVIGSAHSIIDGTTGNGHNAIFGGSYNAILNSTYCSMTSGSRSLIDTSEHSVISGSENYIKGSIGSFISGYRNYINANYATCRGSNNRVLRRYAEASGYNAVANLANGTTVGHSNSMQLSRVILSEVTTNATKGTLKTFDGIEVIPVRNSGLARVYGKITATDGTSYKTFNFDTLYKCTNLASTVISSEIITVFSSAGATSWTIQAQDTYNGFYIRQTGEINKTIKWFASLEIQEFY